ncbi:DegV family protein [Hathewaya limosa]|uniref:DegV family protein with EDD domain n=1 Tax=Hathewaya limosa TaxID=1536 RepID=A0ABU0JTG6_HATLI|nr:DegV family protein [Hathewaya limosa]AWZ47397.1 fatty acid-binding protein DegV [Clostridiaceae bacterium 14S0207]MDQ0480397.1 DegV family protein with EDD domain [Hathewaya limosa]
MAVKILTDSTSYLQENIKKELDIEVICLNVAFDDENFKETDIDNGSFYNKMDKKGIPISSQPSVGEIYDKMKKIIDNGDSIVCVLISSEMSGTYATAHMVKNMILDENPNAKIEIIDSRSNSMQLGFAALVGARAAKEGKSIQEITEIIESNIKKSRFLFIPDNLEYLKKGGRIGGASALIGNFLKIIPILTVENGKTSVLTKVRTKGKAIKTMVDKMLSDIENYGLGEILVHHINCYNEAEELVKLIKEHIDINISICDIGPVIGLHVGPGAIGIVYYTQDNLR